MFDKNKDKIIVLMHENVMHYPPVLNLIECMLNNSYKVHLISCGQEKLPDVITQNELFTGFNVEGKETKSLFDRFKNRIDFDKQFRNELLKQTDEKDIVWTVNPRIIRALGDTLKQYSNRHVMELLELMGDFYPLYQGDKRIGFDIKTYAQKAWKVVVPERNRAYIQKVTWRLKKVPYVLPNKPYYYEPGAITEDMIPAIEQLESENRKIIMYLGVFDPDRTFEEFAQAVEEVKDEFCLCLFGKCASPYKEAFIAFCNRYECVKYMGFFNPPKHLYFLKYAFAALLPYFPGDSLGGTSVLNALYCAPNKIFEYAGANVPMIGTDVLGLREPFEKYNIGVCCDSLDTETIVNAIKLVDKNHDVMMKNCKEFFDSVNLDEIVNRIITE